MKNLLNFFKFLEETKGTKTPIKIKLLNPYIFEILKEDLYVDGDLNLYTTTVTSLPNNLIVHGSLILMNTEVIYLPDNLSVSGYLYLEDTNINSLPSDLKAYIICVGDTKLEYFRKTYPQYTFK